MGERRRSHRPLTRGRHGIALVAVLWVLVLLSVIAAAFVVETRTELNLARNAVDAAKARALADAGVYRAVLGLMERRAEERWRVDGTVYAWRFGGGEIRAYVQDEGGKIDLNHAPHELLQGLFLAVGVDTGAARALADAVLDFRDADDLVRAGGAEDEDYFAAGLDWGAKDAPFEVVSELTQVLGLTRELYERVAPFLTVHSGLAGIDPVFAQREVLLAMPRLTPDEADSVIAAREDSRELSEQWFRQYVEITPYVAPSKGLVYTLRAEARTEGGAVFVREAVVEFAEETDEPPFWFLSWRRGLKAKPTAAEVAGEGGR